MKRSEINHILAHAVAFFRRYQFLLPPWAEWSPAQWARTGTEAGEVRAKRLGWDITDFGSGDFARIGLVLFTVRNGDSGPDASRNYCEKIMIAGVGQVTPCHFHRTKTEDIINRGGGDLSVTLWRSDAAGQRLDGNFTVQCDGFTRTVTAGLPLLLHPGESITLEPGIYHTFHGIGEPVLIGEVSKTNDDRSDNFFYKPAGRFPAIEEDAPAHYPLCFEV
jgi:D-lyxose ketol-isomerase